VQIVTDSGVDLSLTPEQMAGLNIHVVPLLVTLEGTSYRDGVDIKPEAFYRLLVARGTYPTTSQPTVGDFMDTYRRLAGADPEILSIHMSSGLSGTFNTAQTAAKMVPEAKVTIVDTKTLSVAAGWQVEVAARALKAGWLKERVIALLERISIASETLFTLNELKYLIHGGRISHMKGLIASVLDIKPLIGIEKVKGTYVQRGQLRTFQRAVDGLADLIARQHAPGSALHVQVVHAHNPDGAARLREAIDRRFNCTWLPVGSLSTVLGAHTGPSMVGVAYAPLSAFTDIPEGVTP
jgi:DegV family protein with EDD domain